MVVMDGNICTNCRGYGLKCKDDHDKLYTCPNDYRCDGCVLLIECSICTGKGVNE